ncbi:3',5'-cyclic adenosine monophosphate phosphodiesterase CpdA [compost metagenome]
MRIVHLSDIHLSKGNLYEFRNNFKDAIILDLLNFHKDVPVDIIVITGDLIDKGGHSLKEIPEFSDIKNPYEIFKNEFILPIAQGLQIDSKKFIFVPGNHDIDEKSISWFDENQLSRDINNQNINTFLSENINSFRHSSRMKDFKEFERDFHNGNLNYSFSENESIFTYDYNGKKIGFILVNDSWRCKSRKFDGENDKHYFGFNQLYNGLNQLKRQNTYLNICLFHHSLEDFMEEEEITRILINKEIDLFLYGHYHKSKIETYKNTLSNCDGFRGRATLNRPDEDVADYQPGYQIFDFDLTANSIANIRYRKYNYQAIRFVEDTDTSLGQTFSPIPLTRIKQQPNLLELDFLKFNKLSDE